MSVQAIELKRLPPFAAVTPRARSALATMADASTCRRGDMLFEAGKPCSAMLVVLDGLVRLSRPLSGNNDITVAIVGPGGLLNPDALAGHTINADTAEALCNVRTIELPVAEIKTLVARAPDALVPLLQTLVNRCDDILADARADAERTVRTRILHVLRYVASSSAGGRNPNIPSARLGIRLSHADLARLVGVQRTTVTRELRLMAAAGEVVREHGHVVGVALAEPEVCKSGNS